MFCFCDCLRLQKLQERCELLGFRSHGLPPRFNGIHPKTARFWTLKVHESYPVILNCFMVMSRMCFQRHVWEDEFFEWDHLLEDIQHRKDFCNVQTTVTRLADIVVNVLSWCTCDKAKQSKAMAKQGFALLACPAMLHPLATFWFASFAP